jgi:hypothetical protein
VEKQVEKEDTAGAIGMAEFLNMFMVGKKLNDLQLQTGLERFNTDDTDGEKYRWNVDAEPSERDPELCVCCHKDTAQRCQDPTTTSTELQWCVAKHFQDTRPSWHCYKYCFKCWKVRNNWIKRVANYFAWAVDGGLLGSRFPISIPEDDQPMYGGEHIRYGSLLDAMLEIDIWNQLDNHKDVHTALYFMLHMRMVDATRAYDGQLHVIDLEKPDDDCNGLYKFCGLSEAVYGSPWFQKTTKKDAIIYLYKEVDKHPRVPWKDEVDKWAERHSSKIVGTKGRREWWVLVKGRHGSSPREPHEGEELVAFIEARKATSEPSNLAWPRHGPDKQEHWTWNRLRVTAAHKHHLKWPQLLGVYGQTMKLDGGKCWQNTKIPPKGDPPRIQVDKHAHQGTLLSGVEGKAGHPTEELEIRVDAQPTKPVVFMYSDGEFTLLYQQIQYIILTNWEFNDRVMMMLLSKRYFSKDFFKQGNAGDLDEDPVPRQEPMGDPSLKVSSRQKAQMEMEKANKADLADRVRCLGKLLDSNASLDLQAFVCKTLMGLRGPDGAELDEDLCILAVDPLVKLLRKNNLFIATYATAALVNLSKDRSVVKGILLGMHASELCMQNLDTRDEDLMVYTLMLIAHLTKESGHRMVMIDSGLVPKLYDMLTAAYAHFKPSKSNSRRITVTGFRMDDYNGSYTRALKDPEWDIEPKYYRADSSNAVVYIFPERAQHFVIFTTDAEENQHDDDTTVKLYTLISKIERDIYESEERRGEIPSLLEGKEWTVLPLGKQTKALVTITPVAGGAMKVEVNIKTKQFPGEQPKVKDGKDKGKKDENDNSAKNSWKELVEGYYVPKKKGLFDKMGELDDGQEGRKKTASRPGGSASRKGVYMKTLDGPRWWCIAKECPKIDASCRVANDDKVPEVEYEVPSRFIQSAIATNWIDTPDEESYPPFDHWDVEGGDDVTMEPPRVTTHVLDSKEKLLVQLCVVIGQLANEDHYRTLFLYDYTLPGHGPEIRSNKHTMDCLLFMFHQVIGIGDDLTDETFGKQKHQVPLSKVVFAMKQLCANDAEQKKKVGKSIIVPLVRCMHVCHPAKDKLHTEFVFQSFTLLQMLSAVWESMQLLLDVPAGQHESKDEKDLKKDANSNYTVIALNRIRLADFNKTSIGQDSWEERIDRLVDDIKAVQSRLQP